jgi:hypothetical protein
VRAAICSRSASCRRPALHRPYIVDIKRPTRAISVAVLRVDSDKGSFAERLKVVVVHSLL